MGKAGAVLAVGVMCAGGVAGRSRDVRGSLVQHLAVRFETRCARIKGKCRDACQKKRHFGQHHERMCWVLLVVLHRGRFTPLPCLSMHSAYSYPGWRPIPPQESMYQIEGCFCIPVSALAVSEHTRKHVRSVCRRTRRWYCDRRTRQDACRGRA